MARRVVWTRFALQDLIGILEFWNEKLGTNLYAIKLHQSIQEAVAHLAQFPTLGKKFEAYSLRYIVKSHHLIFYRFKNEVLEIIAVWDNRRNPSHLKRHLKKK
jgi:plasmid stabilization system protein ParE